MQFQAAKLRREFARNSEQQKILLGAPPTSQIEEGVSVHNGGYARPRPRQHSQSVLGMLIEPYRSVATQSSRRIVI